MSRDKDASVHLAELAVNEDWTKWNQPALDKLAAEIGLNTEAISEKADVVAAIRARVAEHQRATVREPPAVAAKSYVVTGPRQVCGAAPGEEFTHVFTPEQEAALIEGGHIKPTQPKETP